MINRDNEKELEVAFLELLEKDIEENPENLILVANDFFKDIEDLIEGVELEG